MRGYVAAGSVWVRHGVARNEVVGRRVSCKVSRGGAGTWGHEESTGRGKPETMIYPADILSQRNKGSDLNFNLKTPAYPFHRGRRGPPPSEARVVSLAAGPLSGIAPSSPTTRAVLHRRSSWWRDVGEAPTAAQLLGGGGGVCSFRWWCLHVSGDLGSRDLDLVLDLAEGASTEAANRHGDIGPRWLFGTMLVQVVAVVARCGGVGGV